jgi:mono/diheme cytochrome c family protein
MKSSFIIIAIISLLGTYVKAQTPWVVPDDKKGLLAPVKFTDETRKLGQEIFNKTCVSCHGHPGQPDQAKLVPPPADPASKVYQQNLDGELFYKITEGRGLMPSFKKMLKSEDIWNVISYVRTFNKEYVQKVGSIDSTSGIKGKVSATLNYVIEKNKIDVKIIQQINKLPIIGAKLSLYAKRNFGWLPLDEMRSTNTSGILTFKYPKDLPGDKEGNVNVKVNIANADGTEQTIIDTIIKTDIKCNQNNILDNRAMWNVRSMAPIWLILSYSGAVLAAWGVIFYIIWLLLKIRKKGAEASN